MTILNLKSNLQTQFDNFIETVQSFDNASLNKIPFKGSWTAGQVAQHIIKSTDQLPDKNVAATNRKEDEKVLDLKNLFLDYTLKMEAPDFIAPSLKKYKIDIITQQLEDIKEKHLNSIKSKDLKLLCLEMELPTFGYLTRYEWLYFISIHTQRHSHQLENIMQHLKNRN